MNSQLSTRVGRVKPSATIAVNARATELRREGKDIINLSVGEPDFDTPDYIKEAGKAAIDNNLTRYTAVDGTPELKEAIIQKFKRDNQLEYGKDEVIASTGAKQGLYNLCQAVISEGDEVIIPAPYWVSYPAMVMLADGKPVIVSASHDQQFKITPEQLDAAITEKTKLFMLNSPSNPSGMAYSFDELKALGEVLAKHPHVLIATDDMYEYILWSDNGFCTFLNACPDLRDRTIVFNGVSKAYAMTGWRIGYAGGPANVIKTMKKVQSQSTSNPCSIAQAAAAAALSKGREDLMYMINAFKNRHDQVLADLQSINGIEVSAADGTFYLFPNMSGMIEKLGLASDIELATHLLEQAHVATVPGTAFGMPGFLRLSCATSEEQLAMATKRIRELVA